MTIALVGSLVFFLKSPTVTNSRLRSRAQRLARPKILFAQSRGPPSNAAIFRPKGRLEGYQRDCRLSSQTDRAAASTSVQLLSTPKQLNTPRRPKKFRMPERHSW